MAPSWRRSKTHSVKNTSSWNTVSSIFRNNPPGTGGAGAGNDTIPPLPERAQTELSGLYRLAQLGLEQGWVNTYNLDWEELEAFLKKKFPDVEDFSPTRLPQTGVQDHYVIYTPRPLTDDERDELNVIREAHRERVLNGGVRKQRAEHSPDGPRRPMADDD